MGFAKQTTSYNADFKIGAEPLNRLTDISDRPSPYSYNTKPGRVTSVDEIPENAFQIVPPPKGPEPSIVDVKPIEKKNEAMITIVQIEDAIVKCEVQSELQENRIVNIPKALFEDKITIGMPFTLFFENDSGYRRLLVKKREIQTKLIAKGNEEMSELVNQL